ncbi:ChaN family lipoprotein [Thioflexithrix psekupsensis]|uniref:PDZ domain-containing protein n=1 Tax=Thioflexithrix psekupsensis TaxID=1570016 RepID=A0A251XA32_9GAMM|nr:ChaN family lipoprotein [Thioflexithrix psekupsensis]OUD15292.1 hypothetical protein TPSD3_01820 [Thioflexithrix psekupsensis]
MVRYLSLLKGVILCLLLILPIFAFATPLQYELTVEIDPAQGRLTGHVRLHSETDRIVELAINPDTHFLTKNPDWVHLVSHLAIPLTAGKAVTFSYHVLLTTDQYNWVDDRHLVLIHNWYPKPNTLTQYQFTARLPEGFVANSEADEIIERSDACQTEFTFIFPHPRTELHLVASKDYIYETADYNGIELAAYFFPQHAHLIDTYFEYSRKYLQRYETLLTPYPFKRFAIVANPQPTGYAMATYTLLGQQILSLPFVLETSLAHEILHQWLGHFLYTDYASGNWSEGLTSYLADHALQADNDQDSDYRKNALLKYQAYITPNTAQKARDFTVRHDQISSVIGYNKVMFLFHHLRKQLGDTLFFSGLQHLLHHYAFQTLSWQDLIDTYSNLSQQPLTALFSQYLDRSDIPNITVANAQIKAVKNDIQLQFTVQQNTEQPYQLLLNADLHFSDDVMSKTIILDQKEQIITWLLPAIPTAVYLDPHYDTWRQLSAAEQIPTVDQIRGQATGLIAITPEDRPQYHALLQQEPFKHWTLIHPDEMNFSQLRQHNILTNAFDHPLVRHLFAAVKPPENSEFWLQIHRHPYHAERYITLLHSDNASSVEHHARRIRHYGQYSELRFNAESIDKQQTIAQKGILVFSRPAPQAVPVAAAQPLAHLSEELRRHRVIYIGEQHDNMMHHINQLHLIQQVHRLGEPLAVGLEMFQHGQQAVLDAYLRGELSEEEFLVRSEYFTRWGYDYRLYKPIIDYAKQHHIPLIALNIAGEITRQVARQGLDSLDDKQRAQLPQYIDTTDTRYQQELSHIFSQHQRDQGHADSAQFLQAQLLWDEAMAETAAQFLLTHPEHRLIVLAGNGHIRHGYGIPARVARRVEVSALTFVQGEEVSPGVADYVLLSPPLDGDMSPRLGVMLEEKEGLLIVIELQNDSAAARAGIKKGDQLLRLSDKTLDSVARLKSILVHIDATETVSFIVQRGKQQIEVMVSFLPE